MAMKEGTSQGSVYNYILNLFNSFNMEFRVFYHSNIVFTSMYVRAYECAHVWKCLLKREIVMAVKSSAAVYTPVAIRMCALLCARKDVRWRAYSKCVCSRNICWSHWGIVFSRE